MNAARRIHRLAQIVVLWLAVLPATAAPAPKTIGFTGLLTAPNGTPMPDGNYAVRLALYTTATGATRVWDETKTVAATRGLFSTALGDTTAFPAAVDFSQALFVGVTVGNANIEPELTPRIALQSAPYALFAQTVPYSAVTGAPANLPPSGAAGGDLTGSYPNPAIAANTVGSAKLAKDAGSLGKITGSVIALGSEHIEVLDQDQSSLDGQIAAPHAIQSFTAGIEGDLAAIEVFFGGATFGGSATLSLHAGENLGASGAPLMTQPIIITSGGGWKKFAIAEPPPVLAGQQYTWRISPSDNNPTFIVSTQNPYGGGRSSLSATVDYTFRTYVVVPSLRVQGKLDVNGTVKTNAFQLTTSPLLGGVLTSDVAGVGAWQPLPASFPPSGAAGGDLTGDYPNPSLATLASSLRRVSGNAMTSSGGNIGIGTTAAPTARLEVNGDVRLGVNALLSATAMDSPVRIIAGSVSGTAGIAGGSGFTVIRLPGRPVGGYRITFNTPFTTTPIVTATGQAEADALSATFSNPTNSGVDILLTTPSGFRDTRFSFIAIGGR